MLKILREKKTAKKIFIALAIIIVPAFAFWGVGEVVRNKGRAELPQELRDAINAVRIQALMQFGDNYEQIKKYLNLKEQARERIMLLKEAKRRRISADNKEVIGLIESYPFFQKKGQFDNRIYNDILKYSLRTQPRIFEEQMRGNIMLSKLFKQVTDNLSVQDEEIKEEFLKANEEISIFYIISSPAEFIKALNPSNEELKAYFEKDTARFKQPLSFNAEYVALDSAQKIKAAEQSLKGEDLAKFAKEAGLTLKETGLFSQMDPIPGIGWSPEISGLISNLKVGQLSQPIQADSNVYILKLKERKEAFIPDYENIKDKAKESFLKEESERLALAKIKEAAEKLKEANDFNKAAKETGLKTDATSPFKFGSYIEGLGASDTFWETARRLKENEASGVISLPTGFFIIKLKTKSAFDAKKFEAEKADLSQKLLLQKKQESFVVFTRELQKRSP